MVSATLPCARPEPSRWRTSYSHQLAIRGPEVKPARAAPTSLGPSGTSPWDTFIPPFRALTSSCPCPIFVDGELREVPAVNTIASVAPTICRLLGVDPPERSEAEPLELPRDLAPGSNRYDRVLIHAADAIGRRFLSRHRNALESLPVALFALGPCKEPHDEEEWADCRAQLEKVLADLAWLRPVSAELFGGRFAPALLKFPFSKMAGSEPASDARDWSAIEGWAAGLPALLGLSEQSTGRE